MWWWVVGAFVVGNEMGSADEKKKAAIREDELLNALEKQETRLAKLEFPILLKIELQKIKKRSEPAPIGINELAISLGVLSVDVYDELKENWRLYFKEQPTIKRAPGKGYFFSGVLA